MTDEGITIDDIFEEVPIRIHNSALVMAMLYDWHCEGTMGMSPQATSVSGLKLLVYEVLS